MPTGLFLRLAKLIGQASSDQRGVTAVEFALLTPILTLGALATFDAGSAIYEKMVINQALRAAAQSAIKSQDIAITRDVLVSTAESNFTVVTGGTGDQNTLAVEVTEYCVCPFASSTSVPCVTICGLDGPAQRIFDIAAEKSYVGILLPPIALTGQMEVLLP